MSLSYPDVEPPDRAHASSSKAQDCNHGHLRRATRPWHIEVDAHFSRLDLSTRNGLTAFLLAQARAVPPLEHAIEASGAAALLDDWPARRRTAALDQDLAELGLTRPPPSSAPHLPSSLQGLGALYVLEGAKLGGRVLLRQIQASRETGVRAATRFLAQSDSARWRAFLAMLNALPCDAASRYALVAGASAAFAMFLPSRRSDITRAIPRPGSDLVQSDEA